MRRRLAAVTLAGVAVLAVAGCGERDGAASSPAAVPSAAVEEAAVTDVASAVESAEQLLGSIDAELAQDAADAD